MRSRIAALFLLTIASLSLGAEARGCGCIMSFVQYQPCSAYWGADVVFAGTVTQVGPMIPVPGSGGQTFTSNGRFTRFTVEEAFRGVTRATFETFDHGTSCDYSFKSGDRYFVYGTRDPRDGKVYVSSCSPTNSLDRAEADLAYAQGVHRNEPTPGITGLVVRETRASADKYRSRVGFEGIRVLAESDKRRAEVFTDAKGVFRFYGLSPGSYHVRALTPPDLRRLYGKEIVDVQVVSERCTGGEFTVTSLSTISGKVFNPDDAPFKTRLNLVPIDSSGKEIIPAEGSIETYSNERGDYKFDWLAPGRYLVAVNWRNQPGSYDPPYPRSYLPGVIENEQATVIEVTEGEQVTAGDFRVPPPLIRRTIEGIALMPDGTPAANAIVILEFTARDWSEFQTADAQGRFTLRVYDGFKYLVAAEVRQEVQGVWRATHSPPVEVVAGPVNEPIRVVVSESGFYRPKYAQRKKAN